LRPPHTCRRNGTQPRTQPPRRRPMEPPRQKDASRKQGHHGAGGQELVTFGWRQRRRRRDRQAVRRHRLPRQQQRRRSESCAPIAHAPPLVRGASIVTCAAEHAFAICRRMHGLPRSGAVGRAGRKHQVRSRNPKQHGKSETEKAGPVVGSLGLFTSFVLGICFGLRVSCPRLSGQSRVSGDRE
jgi:hypothetical protein